MGQNKVQRFKQIFFEEANFNHAKIQFARILAAPFPEFTSGRIRAAILRFIGFEIGYGSFLFGLPKISGAGDIYSHLEIGEFVGVGVGCYFDLVNTITIGDQAGIGPEVMFITGTHDIGSAERRVGTLKSEPIVIGKGVWVGARCTIMPGVTIGDGSVVLTGATVSKDVPPGVMVGGNPARVLRRLEDEVPSHNP